MKKIKTKQDFLNAKGTFKSFYGSLVSIQIGEQTFIWKDPRYGGDNTVMEFNGTEASRLANYLYNDYGMCFGTYMVSVWVSDDKLKITFL